MQQSEQVVPSALAAEDWKDRDYRQSAREIDAWAKQSKDAQATDDATEFVAKLGITTGGDGVIVMNRSHDKVIVPPPARRALAALALFEQPFGFAQTDVEALHLAAEWIAHAVRAAGESGGGSDAAITIIRSVAARVAALLPPAMT